MSGYISEFFGYQAEDQSEIALNAAAKKVMPFHKVCLYKDFVAHSDTVWRMHHTPKVSRLTKRDMLSIQNICRKLFYTS